MITAKQYLFEQGITNDVAKSLIVSYPDGRQVDVAQIMEEFYEKRSGELLDGMERMRKAVDYTHNRGPKPKGYDE